MNGYGNYRFKNKDPIIDEVRTIMQAAAELAGMSEVKMRTRIANDIRMSPTTLWSWFEGPTKRPQYASVKAVVRALGYELSLIGGKNINVVKFKPRKVA